MQVSLMTLMAHSNHHCHPFVCFVVVDVMLSNISLAPAFTNFQPIFTFTMESEFCVSRQTMKRRLGEEIISRDIMRHQKPCIHDSLIWLLDLVKAAYISESKALTAFFFY